MTELTSENATNCSENFEWMANTTCFVWGDIFKIVFCSLVIMFGVPGNCLILLVYWNKPRKTSTNVLIMGLAWADFFTCLCLTNEAIPGCFIADGSLYIPWAIARSGMMTAIPASVGITMVIALDRYDCVCRTTKRLLNPLRAKVLILCVVIACASIQIVYILYRIDQSNPKLRVTLPIIQSVLFLIAAVLILENYRRVFVAVRKHAKVGVRNTQQNGNVPKEDNQVHDIRPPTQSPISIVPEANVTADAFTNDAQRRVASSKIDAPCVGNCPEEPTAKSDPELELEERGNSKPPTPGRLFDQNKSNRQREPPQGVPGTSVRHNTYMGHFRSRVPRHANGKFTAVQGRTTMMLFVSSMVLLVSWLPYWCYVGLRAAHSLKPPCSDNVVYIFSKVLVLLYANHAVNPLIYGLANRRFRRDCKEALQKRLFRRAH